MYETHVQELAIVINDKHNDKLVEVGMQALAALCKWDADSVPSDKRIEDRATQLALTGQPRQAKFAARYIAKNKTPGAAKKLVTVSWHWYCLTQGYLG